jgi:hypothetical protein
MTARVIRKHAGGMERKHAGTFHAAWNVRRPALFIRVLLVFEDSNMRASTKRQREGSASLSHH